MQEYQHLSSQLKFLTDKIEKIEQCLNKSGKQVIDIDEASELLNMSKFTLYAKTSKSDIPHYKEGRKIYFKRDELLEYITRKENRRKSNTEIEAEAATLVITQGRGQK